MRPLLLSLFAVSLSSQGVPVKDIALHARAVASSVHQGYTADKVVDGIVDNESRWISAPKAGPHTLTLEFGESVRIGCVQLLSGWCPEGAWIHAVRSFRFEARGADGWQPMPGAEAQENRACAWQCRLAAPVTTDALRLVALDDGFVRVAEIRVFPFDEQAQYPPATAPAKPDVRAGTLCIGGIYPHLAAFSHSGEVGIGAVVPWADRLWYLTYPPHAPQGSTDKLYEIDSDMTMTVRPESVGGTHANRLVHRESDQLIMGPYFIDKERHVRVADLSELHGRMTATARHLTDPANKVYFVDMEGPVYEVDVHSLAVQKLFHKPVPGWHGKGGYTGQGRLVISNNGENHVKGYGLENLEAGGPAEGPEDAGVLAQWDGSSWSIVERRQFTEVTGPGGIQGAPDDAAPLWAMGWDRRSVMLKVLAGGEWYRYRVPKGSYAFDPKHGWYTEWPRIREVFPGRYLMVMHGTMFQFPRGFAPGHTGGLRPIATHLRYIPDFCGWGERLVLAADDASIMQNPLAGQSQSNLWFGAWEDLANFGPKVGFGGVWVDDGVKADTPSDPLLVAGYGTLCLHVQNQSAGEVELSVEGDREGTGEWQVCQTVRLGAAAYQPVVLNAEETGTWLRLRTDRDAKMTAYAHLGAPARPLPADPAFAALASDGARSEALIRPAGHSRNLQVLSRQVAADGTATEWQYMEVDESLAFAAKEDAARVEEMVRIARIKPFAQADECSIFLARDGQRYRLPSVLAYDPKARDLREVQSERYLLNAGGLLYEMPRDDGVPRLRPVCAHRRRIFDFCSWRGLLVLSGCQLDAKPDGRFFGTGDGTGLWFGAVDDLWRLGKVAGSGYVWRGTEVAADQVSDPFLATGFDKKTVVLEHDGAGPASFVVECDFLTTDKWVPVTTIGVPPGERLSRALPEGFAAHWLRVRARQAGKVTAQFVYE